MYERRFWGVREGAGLRGVGISIRARYGWVRFGIYVFNLSALLRRLTIFI